MLDWEVNGWTVTFGAAHAAVILLSLAAWWSDMERYASALGLAMMLAVVWMLSVALVAVQGVPEGMRLFWVLDAAGLACVGLTHWRRPTYTKLAMAVVFACMAILHAAFWTNPERSNPQAYALLLDLLTVAILAIASVPGGRYVADRIRDRLRARRGRGRPAHAGPP